MAGLEGPPGGLLQEIHLAGSPYHEDIGWSTYLAIIGNGPSRPGATAAAITSLQETALIARAPGWGRLSAGALWQWRRRRLAGGIAIVPARYPLLARRSPGCRRYPQAGGPKRLREARPPRRPSGHGGGARMGPAQQSLCLRQGLLQRAARGPRPPPRGRQSRFRCSVRRSGFFAAVISLEDLIPLSVRG